MNICFITEGRIFESAFGGIPSFLFSFARWALSRELEITLMGSTFNGVRADKLSASVLNEKIQDFEGHRTNIRAMHPPYLIYMLSRFFIIILWVAKIRSMNRNSKFSLIHSQDTGYSGLAAVISGRMLKIPVIVTAHGSRYESLQSVIGGRLRGLILRIEYRLEQLTISFADNIVVVNPILKEYYRKRVKHPKIQLFPVPINIKNFSFSEKNRKEVRDELGIHDEILIGYVGRFTLEKNLTSLVSAFSMISQTKEDLKLLLVGTGKLEKDLIGIVNKHGLSKRVIFCGLRNDINRIMSSLDIFVLPSYTEGLSVSLLEAMACERAIICSDIPANRYLLTEKEAMFMDPYDNSSLASAMLKLLNDARLRESLGKNANLQAQEYDQEKVFRRLLSYYEEISNPEGKDES